MNRITNLSPMVRDDSMAIQDEACEIVCALSRSCGSEASTTSEMRASHSVVDDLTQFAVTRLFQTGLSLAVNRVSTGQPLTAPGKGISTPETAGHLPREERLFGA